MASPSIVIPRNALVETVTSPTVSSPTWCSRSIVTDAPIRSSVRKNPIRVSFKQTSVVVTRLFGTMAAPAQKKAADEGSAGMESDAPFKRPGLTRTVRAAPLPSTETSAPNSGNMRSVWSRDKTGSRTVAPSRA